MPAPNVRFEILSSVRGAILGNHMGVHNLLSDVQVYSVKSSVLNWHDMGFIKGISALINQH